MIMYLYTLSLTSQLSLPAGTQYLTLKAPITTAADDIC